MAEERLTVQLGTSYSQANYDDVMRGVGVLYPKDEQDPYIDHLVDEYYQFERILEALRNIPRVYKDSSDSDLQCSITAGEWLDRDGTLRTTAAKTNITLTDDSDNYLYYPHDAADNTDLVVNTTGFPSATTSPYVPIAKVTTSSGVWSPSDVTDYRFRNIIKPVFGHVDHVQSRAWSHLGPFIYTNLAAGLSDAALSYGGETEGIVMPKAGYLVAASVRLNAVRSADTATFKPSVNGSSITSTGLNLVIDGTNTQQDYATVTWGTSGYNWTAGQRLGVNVTTGASWAPTTAEALAELWVVFDA